MLFPDVAAPLLTAGPGASSYQSHAANVCFATVPSSAATASATLACAMPASCLPLYYGCAIAPMPGVSLLPHLFSQWGYRHVRSASNWGNLPDSTTARRVKHLVRQFGWVVSVEVKTSRHSTGLLSWSLPVWTAVMPFLEGRHSQSALFPDHRSCRKAIESLNGHEGHGCRLRVQMSRGHRDPFGRRGASSPERYVCLFRASS